MSVGSVPVTVVIPAYRRAAMVTRAVASVRAQTGVAADEVLVVDDASGDDTGEAAARAGARVVTHAVNGGEGAARNTGIAEARNDWIALLDSDDEWLPGHLASLWAARDGHVLVADAAIGTGDRPEHHRIYGWPGPGPRELRSPRDVAFPDNVVQPSCALVRREAVVACGGFPAGRPRAGDLDTWLRLLETGSGIALPDVGVRYHLHGGQVSAERSAMHDAHREVVAAYADRPWHDERLDAWLRARAMWDADRHAAMLLAARSPSAARGLATTLWWRRRVRRASAAVDGEGRRTGR